MEKLCCNISDSGYLIDLSVHGCAQEEYYHNGFLNRRNGGKQSGSRLPSSRSFLNAIISLLLVRSPPGFPLPFHLVQAKSIPMEKKPFRTLDTKLARPSG